MRAPIAAVLVAHWAPLIGVLVALVAVADAAPIESTYPYARFQFQPFNAQSLGQLQEESVLPPLKSKRSNAELINGLIGMDLNTLHAIGKRGNAELINGLIGMDLNTLHAVGKRGNAELINGLIGMDLNRLGNVGRR